ncbi:MAG: response regulator [Oceanospirillaceae bacterium]|nr:response regulator [Oceanospirillaceae bacterium]MCP5334098.1 response regulator [Oceanospirillaceae bacterium]MCP5351266.1 response regulator [Oceanospirillaceae bacterium]
MRPGFFTSLQNKLLFPLFGLLGLFILVLALAVDYVLNEISRQQSEDYAAETADYFLLVAEKDAQQKHLQRILQLLASHERIREAYVVDAAGTVYAAHDVARIGAGIDSFFPDVGGLFAILQNPQLHEHFINLQRNTLLLHHLELLNERGDAFVPYSFVLVVANQLPSHVMRILQWLAWFGFGVLVALWLAQLFYMRWLLFTPLKRMADELARQQLQNNPVYLSRTSGDELGRLANQYNQLLAQQFASRNDLVIARDMAQQNSEFKSQFLANISHEVRTPLNGMLGFAQLLLRSPLNEKQHEYVERMLRSGESLLVIINDVLDFSKIEAGKLEINESKVGIEQLCSDVLSLNAVRAEQKKIDLCLVMQAGAELECELDELRLKQILLNLVSNAVKFTEKGYVLLEVSAQGGWLQLKVQDTGIGMGSSVLESIFRPFVQADASTTRRFGGTGLGLSIAQRLCELMGGELRVESAVGIGTSFFVRLPLKSPRFGDGFEKDPRSFAVCTDSGLPGLETVLLQQLQPLFARPGQILQTPEALEQIDLDLLFVHVPAGRVVDGKYVRRVKSWPVQRYVLIASVNQLQTKLPADMLLLEKPLLLSKVMQVLTGNVGVSATAQPEDIRLRGRVLVVDDTDINRIVLQDYLQGLGLEVAEAANGLVAVDLCQQQTFDVVLMDCLMPEMDGYEATRQIRSAGQNINVPIIAITANAYADVEVACRQAGMTDYLAKPVDLQQLNRLLEHYLSQRSSKEAFPELSGARALRERFGAKKFTALLEISEQSLAGYAQQLPDALRECEFSVCERICHSIKSIAGNYGDVALQEISRDLEQRFHGGEFVPSAEVRLYLERCQLMLGALRQLAAETPPQ